MKNNHAIVQEAKLKGDKFTLSPQCSPTWSSKTDFYVYGDTVVIESKSLNSMPGASGNSHTINIVSIVEARLKYSEMIRFGASKI